MGSSCCREEEEEEEEEEGEGDFDEEEKGSRRCWRDLPDVQAEAAKRRPFHDYCETPAWNTLMSKSEYTIAHKNFKALLWYSNEIKILLVRPADLYSYM